MRNSIYRPVPRWLWLATLVLALLDLFLLVVIPQAAQAATSTTFAISRAAVVAKIKDSPIEMLYVLDAHGRILAHSTGDVDSVRVPRQAAGNYTIHNHPGQRYCQLSKADILGAQANGEWGTEAVCADGSSDIWAVLP